MSNAIEYKQRPVRKFRWVFSSPGFRAWTAKRIFQEPGGLLTIETHVCADDDFGVCPITALCGLLKLLDSEGNTVRQAELHWEDIEYLPFTDLDYENSGTYTVCTVLHGVKVTWL